MAAYVWSSWRDIGRDDVLCTSPVLDLSQGQTTRFPIFFVLFSFLRGNYTLSQPSRACVYCMLDSGISVTNNNDA